MTYLKCMENTFDCNLDVSHDRLFRFAETKMCRVTYWLHFDLVTWIFSHILLENCVMSSNIIT